MIFPCHCNRILSTLHYLLYIIITHADVRCHAMSSHVCRHLPWLTSEQKKQTNNSSWKVTWPCTPNKKTDLPMVTNSEVAVCFDGSCPRPWPRPFMMQALDGMQPRWVRVSEIRHGWFDGFGCMIMKGAFLFGEHWNRDFCSSWSDCWKFLGRSFPNHLCRFSQGILSQTSVGAEALEASHGAFARAAQKLANIHLGMLAQQRLWFWTVSITAMLLRPVAAREVIHDNGLFDMRAVWVLSPPKVWLWRWHLLQQTSVIHVPWQSS